MEVEVLRKKMERGENGGCDDWIRRAPGGGSATFDDEIRLVLGLGTLGHIYPVSMSIHELKWCITCPIFYFRLLSYKPSRFGCELSKRQVLWSCVLLVLVVRSPYRVVLSTSGVKP